MDFLTDEKKRERESRQVSITSQRKKRQSQTEREREKRKEKESTSIGIFDLLLCTEYYYIVFCKRGGAEPDPIRNGARDSPVSC